MTVNATAGADMISVAKSGGAITVSGLAATVTIAHADAGLDVRSIKDVTPVPHNGCRPPKRRRV